MVKFRNVFIGRFAKSTCGATLVEYGVALIAAIVIGGSGLISLGEGASENMADASIALDDR